VVNDFSVDEQLYLYELTRELKEGLLAGKPMDQFRIGDRDLSIYLLFLEDSTRTKESFRNAAEFHRCRVNNFEAKSSSFNKKESLTDTVKMLTGYAKKSVFIIRSAQEGTCTWLADAMGEYASKLGLPRPAFLNAGDGKHEHPTQEFLDEFSFLEQKNWDRSSLHLALVGDLFHGRTVHSKADGLRAFGSVKVDLVAPPELAMPPYYEDKMRANGYQVRKYASIDEYLDAGDPAEAWYFTRLQLERMGDKVLDKAKSLRKAVTFRKSHRAGVREGTKFYHPLPRHREYPVVPTWLDKTELNGYDAQSVNGYYTRIIEIGLLAGRLGADFSGRPAEQKEYLDDFVEDVPILQTTVKKEYKLGIRPVEEGMVIDHIGRGSTIEEIWNHIDKIRKVFDLNLVSSHGVYRSERGDHYKGIISLPDYKDFDETRLKMLAAIAPECTLNLVSESRVIRKYRLHMPPRIYKFDDISCKNPGCISHPDHFEPIDPEFFRLDRTTFSCKYCERPHGFYEIWDN
jgi:aspartate carbamoyltransferase